MRYQREKIAVARPEEVGPAGTGAAYFFGLRLGCRAQVTASAMSRSVSRNSAIFARTASVTALGKVSWFFAIFLASMAMGR